MEKSSLRRVYAHSGRRRADNSPYNCLKFEGPHRDFLLTPGQVKTVLALGDEAQKILQNLPQPSPQQP